MKNITPLTHQQHERLVTANTEQFNKISKLSSDFQKKLAAISEDSTLTSEEKLDQMTTLSSNFEKLLTTANEEFAQKTKEIMN